MCVRGRQGEANPAAKLTNREVDLLLALAAELDEHGKRRWSRKQLAEKFEVSVWTVISIEQGRRR